MNLLINKFKMSCFLLGCVCVIGLGQVNAAPQANSSISHAECLANQSAPLQTGFYQWDPLISALGRACRSASDKASCKLLSYKKSRDSLCLWHRVNGSFTCSLDGAHASKYLDHWDSAVSSRAVDCAAQINKKSCLNMGTVKGIPECVWLSES